MGGELKRERTSAPAPPTDLCIKISGKNNLKKEKGRLDQRSPSLKEKYRLSRGNIVNTLAFFRIIVYTMRRK